MRIGEIAARAGVPPKTPYQHHFIVQSVEGDTVSSIDGNSGGNGSIQSESHSKSGSTFYTAFAPPSGQ